jgi:plasmid stabilization system protein ParE
MSFGLIISPKAEETYDAIISQIRQRWGDGVVLKFEIKVEKSVNTIVINPYIYPISEENTEIRKCILHKLFNAV